MTRRRPLEWIHDEDGRLGWPACAECSQFMMDSPYLLESVASVAIETPGKSTADLLRDFINAYHARRHQWPE